MGKIVYSIGALLTGAAIVLVLSWSALVGSQVMSASVVRNGEQFRSTETTSAISPFEITVKQTAKLPVESWDAF
jgi:hypothetical protein